MAAGASLLLVVIEEVDYKSASNRIEVVDATMEHTGRPRGCLLVATRHAVMRHKLNVCIQYVSAPVI